jgi:hypothetical protein
MKKLLFICAIALFGCAKEEDCISDCGTLIERSRVTVGNGYEYNYTIENTCGDTTYLTGIFSQPFYDALIGGEICANEIW